MTSTLGKFDPAAHLGNVYDAFIEFTEAFAYEYEAICKQPPAGTTDAAGWIELDKRKQMMGRYASRNLQKDFEAEVPEGQRSTITYKDTIDKLKTRYKPTRNTTLSNYNFHRIHQGSMESYDTFVNRVKQEASNCNFKCGDTCTVADTLVRDQIIIGTTDNDIRTKALGEQWELNDLVTKGRQMEAAAVGVEKIKAETKLEGDVARVKPGKYSRKASKGNSGARCMNCSNKSCEAGTFCIAYGKDCFLCGGRDHFKGAPNCKKKKGPKKKNDPEKTRRVNEKSETSSSEDSSEGDETLRRLSSAKGISPANFVSHVRRAARRVRKKQHSRYQVPVVLKEKIVHMFADTGADVSVISKGLAEELNLPLIKTDMRIRPYGMKKRIKCKGYYVGPIMYDENIVNVGIYVVNKDVEPLLSGHASEALGIITFNGEGCMRRSEAEREEEQDPIKQ